MSDVRYLNIVVAAQVDGGTVHEQRASMAVPPAYDAADVRAMIVRGIEDTAFDLTRKDFRRAPTKQALVAAVARIRAIRDALDQTVTPDAEGLTALRVRIRELIDTDNATITEQWGDDPEGA